MKLLHLVNEKSDSIQDIAHNPREAFRELKAEGIIEDVVTFSFLSDWLKHSDTGLTHKKILELVKKHLPNVLFWQHIAKFPVNDQFFSKLRSHNPRMLIVYHEGDPYAKHIKKITNSMSCIIRNADMVFWEGLGSLREFAIQHGAKRMYFSPSNFDSVRFWDDWNPTYERKFDVSMIARRGKSRLPFRYLPGGRQREKCVSGLNQTFGERFALFGYGWNKFSSYQGPIAYEDQHKAIRESWVSVNWDHFDDISFYNSDRLPISMAAGVPHITTYHKGFEYLYKDAPGLYLAHTPADIIDIACYLLSKSKDELIEEGLKAKMYAYQRLSAIVVYRQIINKINESLGCPEFENSTIDISV